MAALLPGVPGPQGGPGALDPASMGQGAPAAPQPDATGGQGGGDVITITDNDDGTYSVQMQDSDSDPGAPADPGDPNAQPQTCQSVGQVLQVVKQMLTQDAASEGSDNGAPTPNAWAAEASTRDASGKRKPSGGPGGPSMSM